VLRNTHARLGDSFHNLSGVTFMDNTPRCQDCGGAIQVENTMGGRRAWSIQFCEQCTKRHETLEASEKRRTIVSVIAGVIVLTALVVFLLARG
jgi:hypothetical protein